VERGMNFSAEILRLSKVFKVHTGSDTPILSMTVDDTVFFKILTELSIQLKGLEYPVKNDFSFYVYGIEIKKGRIK
jgi:hypothetical protein